MKKIALLLILLILPSVLAISLKVEKQSSDEVMIIGLKDSTIFDLKITNLGATDSFEFYNLLGFEMFPVGTTPINQWQTKNIELKISPIGELSSRGTYTFNYFIKGQDSSEITQELTFKIIDLKDAFEITAGEIDSASNSIEIYLHNKVNFNFEEVNIKVTSAFFEFEETFSLTPNKRKDFTVQLNKEDFKKLTAGFYTLNIEISVKDEKIKLEETIKFTESNLLITTKKDYGLVVNTKIITKTNEGNVLEKSVTTLEKNIISRLFTSFSPEPDIVGRQGTAVFYTWSREIKPGESLEIIVKTNWLFPFLGIFFIIVISILTKQYSGTDLLLRKKVSFVKAKGGEFALKITVFAKAKKYVERVSIIDRLPALTKIYERFGGEQPTRVNEKNKRIEWDFEKLEQGETRVLSYILYSKIGVVGKFALPPTTAIYEREGKIKETESNKAYFVAEQKKEKGEERDY